MYKDTYTVTKGRLYSPVEYLQWFYCHFVSFSKGYKIQPVNKLDFRFKVTAAPSEAIFRYLILRTLNVLYFTTKRSILLQKWKDCVLCFIIFTAVGVDMAATANTPSSLSPRKLIPMAEPSFNCLRKSTSLLYFSKRQSFLSWKQGWANLLATWSVLPFLVLIWKSTIVI